MRSILDQVEDEAQYQRTSTMLSTLLHALAVSTYQPTAKIAGYGDNQARNPNYHRHLGRTMEEDLASGSSAIRASLIINVKYGMPGESYFQKARSLGFLVGITAAEERTFWMSEIRRMGFDPGNLRIV